MTDSTDIVQRVQEALDGITPENCVNSLRRTFDSLSPHPTSGASCSPRWRSLRELDGR